MRGSVTLVLVTLCIILGLVVGSFLNVVIARVPAGESVVRPGSRCPACGEPVTPRDNVPVLSWLLLRGRARCCSARISARYPLVEALTAAAFGFLAAATGLAWELPALLYLAALSIALAVIDIDTLRLPFAIVDPSYVVAAVLLAIPVVAARDLAAAGRTLAGAAIAWGLYMALRLIYPHGMGYGDVHLSGVLGLYLGWAGWANVAVGLFAGFFIGGLAGIGFVLAGRRTLRSSIPYGPYLLAGAWVGLLAGPPIAAAYLRASGF